MALSCRDLGPQQVELEVLGGGRPKNVTLAQPSWRPDACSDLWRGPRRISSPRAACGQPMPGKLLLIWNLSEALRHSVGNLCTPGKSQLCSQNQARSIGSSQPVLKQDTRCGLPSRQRRWQTRRTTEEGEQMMAGAQISSLLHDRASQGADWGPGRYEDEPQEDMVRTHLSCGPEPSACC